MLRFLIHVRGGNSFPFKESLVVVCQKPDRQEGPLSQDALPDGRATDALDIDTSPTESEN
jgi:hypothetical protein